MAMYCAFPAGLGSPTNATFVLVMLTLYETLHWRRLLSQLSHPAHMPNGAVTSWSAMHAEMLTKNPAFTLLQCVLFLVVGTEDSLDGGQYISLQTIIVMGCASPMVSVSK